MSQSANGPMKRAFTIYHYNTEIAQSQRFLAENLKIKDEG